MVGTLVRVCRYGMSWCNLDLTVDLVIVTLSWSGCVDMECHGVILI